VQRQAFLDAAEPPDRALAGWTPIVRKLRSDPFELLHLPHHSSTN